MQSQSGKVFAWLIGIVAMAFIVWFFRPSDFIAMLNAVGFSGVAGWVVVTLAARFMHGETTVVPLAALGHRISRSDVFWIGWIRTFVSQILPLSGIVAYSQAIRSRTSISWSALAALATPQFVLAATSLGMVGCLAVLVNGAFDSGVLTTLLFGYVGLTIFSLLLASNMAMILGALPFGFAVRVRKTSAALRELSKAEGLLIRLVIYHALVILLRGMRLWLLFELTGFDLDWQQAMLLVAIAESTVLIQLTPGSLGLREGAILGGAALVGVAASAALSVALIDRLLVISITSLMTPPSFLMLRRAPVSD